MSSDAVKRRKPKVIRNEAGTPETKRGRAEGDQVSSSDLKRTEELKPLVLVNVCDVIVAEQSINPQFFFFSNNSDVRVQLSAVSSHVKFRKVRLRQVQVPSSMFHSFRLQMSFFHELCSDEIQ